MNSKLAMFIAFLFILSGCTNTNLNISDYQKKEKIVLGTNAQIEPFSYYENGNITGIDINIAQKVADRLGVSLEIKDMNFESLQTNLANHKIDFIISAVSKNNDDTIQLGLSDTYYNSEQVVIILKNGDINSIKDLKDKTVGIPKGRFDIEEAKRLTSAEIEEYNTGVSALIDLKDKKLDAVIFDKKSAEIWQNQNPDIKILDKIKDEEYVAVVREGEQELKKVINEVIKEFKLTQQ